jgi:hypothetical protein
MSRLRHAFPIAGDRLTRRLVTPEKENHDSDCRAGQRERR